MREFMRLAHCRNENALMSYSYMRGKGAKRSRGDSHVPSSSHEGLYFDDRYEQAFFDVWNNSEERTAYGKSFMEKKTEDGRFAIECKRTVCGHEVSSVHSGRFSLVPKYSFSKVIKNLLPSTIAKSLDSHENECQSIFLQSKRVARQVIDLMSPNSDEIDGDVDKDVMSDVDEEDLRGEWNIFHKMNLLTI